MKKIFVCTILPIVMAITFLGACAPAATTTKPASPTTSQVTTSSAPPQTTTAVTPVTPSGKPQYGGVITLLNATNYTIFGAAVSNRGPQLDGTVLEQITYPDRTRGPAGSGTSLYYDGPTSMQDVIGRVAEKWSTPSTNKWVLDIRRGIHFQVNPASAGALLANGRELTADDVKTSLEFIRDTPSSWARVAEPSLLQNMTVEKTGPWQITVNTPVQPNTAYLWLMGGGGSQYVWPKEFLEKYGTNNDWRVQVGSGPYILSDFVDNSAITFKRNTNYWEKNPVGAGKGDQLPYAEGVKILIVPDTSAQLAALRTGKADLVNPPSIMQREDAETLLKSNPDMKSASMLLLPFNIGMRKDKADLPYKDKRVRQALMLATDQPSILNGLYGGKGELLDSPARRLYPSIYTPLDQLPKSTQELFGYNPDKAKQLLTEAGYPNGFKASMMVNSLIANVDMAQTIKAQWAKVGVDVDIQVKEPVVFQQIWTKRDFPDLMLTDLSGGNGALFVRYSFGYYRGTNSYNISYVNDPPGSDAVLEKAYQDVAKVINVDPAACDKIMKDTVPYIYDQAFLISLPAPQGYRVWQPWLKDYNGDGSGKYFLQYVWIDQALKAKGTGGR